MGLAAAVNTDFFTFFRLAETRREKDSTDHDVVVFKPGSDMFRKLVTIRATMGAGDRITQLELDLARSFIDSPAQRVFANDITASMLRSTPSRADLKAVGSLAMEIRNRPVPGTETFPIGSSSPPSLPAQESPGFQTYVGTRDSYSHQFSRCKLLMQKVDEDTKPWLQIRLTANH